MTRKSSRRNGRILYTALYGNYDVLRDPVGDLPGWSLIAYSDREWLTDKWEVIVEPRPVNSYLTARRKKVLFHELFPKAKCTLWIDGNIQVTADFIKWVSTQNWDIALSKHGYRDCVYQEAEACMHLGKDVPANVHPQINKYFNEGYPPHNGMVESGVLFRRNKKHVRELCKAWWEEIERYSHRDQLSFNYACWKTGAEYATYPESIRTDERIKIMSHVPRVMRPNVVQTN